jgi:SAM-dependent methyltransferase
VKGRSPGKSTSRSSLPSRLLVQCAHAFMKEFPILDAGCGVGRNALALAHSGFNVVCADRDQHRLGKLIESARPNERCGKLLPVCANLGAATWPFGSGCFSAVVCVHYLDLAVLPAIHASLVPDGCLYIETVGGQGQNYLELPSAGQVRELLLPRFQLKFYEERPVGPLKYGRRAVKLLAEKPK